MKQVTEQHPGGWNSHHTFYGCCGLAGVALLGVSFAINQGPAPGAELSALVRFISQRRASVVWGAWLQALGPVFISLFALGLIRLAHKERTMAATATLLGCVVLMIVNLIEVTLYWSALFVNPNGMPQIALEMIYSVQHLYFIVAAPLLFSAVGIAIWDGRVLPRLLAYVALFLAALFAILGCVTLSSPVLPNGITALGAVQALWWLVASVCLIFTRHP